MDAERLLKAKVWTEFDNICIYKMHNVYQEERHFNTNYLCYGFPQIKTDIDVLKFPLCMSLILSRQTLIKMV